MTMGQSLSVPLNFEMISKSALFRSQVTKFCICCNVIYLWPLLIAFKSFRIGYYEDILSSPSSSLLLSIIDC